MAEKRTKADKAQRQADQLEKKARHPQQERGAGFPGTAERRRMIVRGADDPRTDARAAYRVKR